jgi:hypothetical protein
VAAVTALNARSEDDEDLEADFDETLDKFLYAEDARRVL